MLPDLRAIAPRNGVVNTRSAPSRRRVAVSGCVLVHGHRAHHTVEGPQRARVVADEQRPALVRDVVDADRLGAEPLPVQRTGSRQDDAVGEIRVEAEVIDLVVTADPSPQEGEPARDRSLPSRA